MSHMILVTLVLFSITIAAQNVGIGTDDPKYKLDIESSLDTTFRVLNLGRASVSSHNRARVGIFNKIDNLTAGTRKGIFTHIGFPNLAGQSDKSFIGHEIVFNGDCVFGSGNCNESGIYGVKVDIPPTINDGIHHGFYAKVPRTSGYAGFFDGRSYFSKNVGIGTNPHEDQQFTVEVEEQPLNNLWRTAKFSMISANSPLSDVENIWVSTVGKSVNNNVGGKFSTLGTTGTTYGILNTVQNIDGPSTGIYSSNNSPGGTRIGIRSDVGGSGQGAMNGVIAEIDGNAGSSAVYGVRSYISAGSTTGFASAIHCTNQNTSGESYAGFFSGRSKMINGQVASYNSHGLLQLGNENGSNLVMDENEILARNNGGAATLYLQHEGGDLLISPQKNGKVGIGLNNTSVIPAGYILGVEGKGIFEEVRVELNDPWPDYVFEDQYNLISIPELQLYIQENGHLPNIPSAKKVAEDGLQLGDMQKRMMEKIEELALYIIQQNQRITKLEKQLDKSLSDKN